MTENITHENLDLTNCDREPIHIPGLIQSHGVLLVVDTNTFNIVQCSENTLTHLTKSPDEVLGKPIDHIIGGEIGKQLINSYVSDDYRSLNTNIINLSRDNTEYSYTVFAHKALDGRLLVELELIEDDTETSSFDDTLYNVLDSINQKDDITVVCNNVAEVVREYTHFDRVMIYRFDEHWNGQVIAESRIASLEPYLGLHYPASDIPKQARQLYTLNHLRIISDVRSSPVGLMSIDPNQSPIDMSMAQLRSVSPIHIEYLINMGVGASMSISIVRDGELWGLIACHHTGPKIINRHKKIACTILARTLSLVIAEKERAQQLFAEAEASKKLTLLFEQMNQQQDDLLVKSLVTDTPNLLDIMALWDFGW